MAYLEHQIGAQNAIMQGTVVFIFIFVCMFAFFSLRAHRLPQEQSWLTNFNAFEINQFPVSMPKTSRFKRPAFLVGKEQIGREMQSSEKSPCHLSLFLAAKEDPGSLH